MNILGRDKKSLCVVCQLIHSLSIPRVESLHSCVRYLWFFIWEPVLLQRRQNCYWHA